MANASINTKRFDLNQVLLFALIVLVLALGGYLVYSIAHHNTDDLTMGNHQTKLDQPLKTPN